MRTRGRYQARIRWGMAAMVFALAGCGDSTSTDTERRAADPNGGLDDPADQGPRRRLPNLMVGRFQVAVKPEGGLKVSGVVTNRGLRRVRKKTRVEIVQVGADGKETALDSAKIAPIRAGRSRPFELEIGGGNLEASPDLLVRARADADQAVRERNEDDNTAEAPVVYGPDLMVMGIEKAESKDPQKVELVADLRNIGSTASGAFKFQWEYKLVRELKAEQVRCFELQEKLATVIRDYNVQNNTNAHVDAQLFQALVEQKWLSEVPLDPGQTDVRVDRNYEASEFAPGLRCRVHLARAELEKAEQGPGAEPVLTWRPLEGGGSPSVAPGQRAEKVALAFTMKPEMAGQNVAFRLVADPENVLGETDEGNNDGAVEHFFPAPNPDLYVYGLSAGYDRRGKEITFHSFLRNVGKGDTPAGFDSQWSQVVTPGTPAAPEKVETLSELLQHEILRGGEQEAADKRPKFVWTPPEDLRGQVAVLRYEVDRSQAIVEEGDSYSPEGKPIANASNNLYQWNFKVPERLVPDLAVGDLVSSIDNNGRTIRVEGEIKNLGNLETGAFKVQWVVGDKVLTTYPGKSLPPTGGGKHALYYPVRDEARERGSESFVLKVLPGAEDKDESNNLSKVDQKIPSKPLGPDLQALRAAIRLERSGPGVKGPDRVRVTATVRNVGDEASQPYAFSFSLLESGGGSRGKSEAGLKPGASRAHSWVHELQPKDFGQTWFARFQVVPGGTDARKDNDSADSTPVTLPPFFPGQDKGRPDLAVTRIVPDYKSLSESRGQSIRMRAVVQNVGPAQASGFNVIWFVNGEVAKERQVPGLAAGALLGSDKLTRDAVTLEHKFPQGEIALDVFVGVDYPSMVIEEDEPNQPNNWNYMRVPRFFFGSVDPRQAE